MVEAQGERLLGVDVLSGSQCGLAHRVVGLEDGQVDHELGGCDGIVEELVGGAPEIGGEPLGPRVIDVVEADEIDDLVAQEIGGVTLADVPASDDHRPHHRPADPFVEQLETHSKVIGRVPAIRLVLDPHRPAVSDVGKSLETAGDVGVTGARASTLPCGDVDVLEVDRQDSVSQLTESCRRVHPLDGPPAAVGA